jgi:hypothetical protein
MQLEIGLPRFWLQCCQSVSAEIPNQIAKKGLWIQVNRPIAARGHRAKSGVQYHRSEINKFERVTDRASAALARKAEVTS